MIPQYYHFGDKLDRYLFARHIPLENKEIYTKKKMIEKEILENVGVKHVSELGRIFYHFFYSHFITGKMCLVISHLNVYEILV